MTLRNRLIFVCLAATAPGWAATVKGTVKNLTTGRPAAGDEVVLLSLAFGMTQIGRASTDPSGEFRFTVPENPARRLVRVVHQGVSYHTMVPPGSGGVEVEVYDVDRRRDGVSVAQQVLRLRTEGDVLWVAETITVRNASHPPHTVMNERPLEIQLAAEAKVESAMVQIGSAQPVRSMLGSGGRKGRYYFSTPLRPGDTRFAVVYRLPYKGEAMVQPTMLYPVKQFGVAVPKQLKFEAEAPGMFQATADTSSDNVWVTAAVKPGQPLGFRVSGAAAATKLPGEQQPAQGGERPTRQAGPTGSPGPMHGDGWLIFGGLALVCAAATAGAVRARKHKRERPPRGSALRNRRTFGFSRS